jgi:hypothetical protein
MEIHFRPQDHSLVEGLVFLLDRPLHQSHLLLLLQPSLDQPYRREAGQVEGSLLYLVQDSHHVHSPAAEDLVVGSLPCLLEENLLFLLDHIRPAEEACHFGRDQEDLSAHLESCLAWVESRQELLVAAVDSHIDREASYSTETAVLHSNQHFDRLCW